MITGTGVYDIPEDEYHADPVEGGSLSSTGARRLLPPSCPAKFRYEQDNPTEPKKHFDIGTAAHMLVLGVGPEIVIVDAENWRTNKAKDAAAKAREAGAIPLLPKEYEPVEAMAAALRNHEAAARLLAPGTGHPEQTLVWTDPVTGVRCRARPDWVPTWLAADGRLVIPDYKTAAKADTDSFEKSMGDYGYHQQADWVQDGVVHTGLAKSRAEVAFVFIVQEKTAPYLVNVVEPDVPALERGAAQNAAAREIYAACVATGRWPGYSDDIELAALPPYVERRIDNALDRGDYTALIPKDTQAA